ncbi:MAG: tripartite tricarboxylate transporter substrate binding protein [Betaproteobacteria bacterium]|nr:MAG: tripartite tricarboxylate transporter substrate binding protein [Betaproteobacteria bacterium]
MVRTVRLLGLMLALHTGFALAQAWPAKPLKLVTPFPPAGSADVIARLIGQQLSEQLGQPVVIDNRPGAGGVVGNEYAAKQPPDGYTLLLITGAYPVQAAMLKSLPFDPLADIAMVSMLTTYPFVISVRPDSPFRTLAELIAYAKAHPGKLNFPSSGVGTVHHLSGELLNAMAGIEMVHVPFRGGASPLTEVLGGRVDLLLEAMTLSIGQIRAGKLRPLAVTSRERWKALPDVPTVAETVPGYEVNSFIGLGVTGRTPEPIIARLNAEVRNAVAGPQTHQRFIELGGAPGASTPPEMRTLIEREIAKWRSVIAARRIERE